jgi:hypothetical protein
MFDRPWQSAFSTAKCLKFSLTARFFRRQTAAVGTEPTNWAGVHAQYVLFPASNLQVLGLAHLLREKMSQYLRFSKGVKKITSRCDILLLPTGSECFSVCPLGLL